METPLACYVCSRIYKLQCVLNRHLREVHKVKVLPGGNLKCPLCESFTVNRQASLRLHLEESHAIQCERRNIKFSSYAVFQRWKSSEEKVTLYSYTKKTSTKVVAGQAERFYFHCHRSGHYQTKSTGERRLKSQGSNRMESTCPSMMVVTKEATGQTKVNYWGTHVGHQADLIHTILPRKERARILGRRRPRPANIVPKIENDVLAEGTSDRVIVLRIDDDVPTFREDDRGIHFRPKHDLRDIRLTVLKMEDRGALERLRVPAFGSEHLLSEIVARAESSDEAILCKAEMLLEKARRVTDVGEEAAREALRLMDEAMSILGEYEVDEDDDGTNREIYSA